MTREMSSVDGIVAVVLSTQGGCFVVKDAFAKGYTQ